MKRARNIVSILEITELMYKAKSEFDREIEYQKWLKDKEEIENQIMDDINKSIEKKLIDLNKENTERIKEVIDKNQNQKKENFIDLPSKVYLWNNGTFFLYPDDDERDSEFQIVYSLHIATDVKTGNLSIQYTDENGSFLSHKEIVKIIKIKNSIGKYGR